MPYGRLQYNWDSQYTTKDKRNLLLTQEVIEKINNIMPGDSIDAVVETKSHTPYATKTFAELEALWDMDLVIGELNNAPLDYYNSLIDEEVLRNIADDITISEDGENPWAIDYSTAKFVMGMWTKGGK